MCGAGQVRGYLLLDRVGCEKSDGCAVSELVLLLPVWAWPPCAQSPKSSFTTQTPVLVIFGNGLAQVHSNFQALYRITGVPERSWLAGQCFSYVLPVSIYLLSVLSHSFSPIIRSPFPFPAPFPLRLDRDRTSLPLTFTTPHLRRHLCIDLVDERDITPLRFRTAHSSCGSQQLSWPSRP